MIRKRKRIKFSYRKLVALAISAFIAVTTVYIMQFSENGLSENPEQWAQFGDYLGGVLNPLLAFFSLLALLHTINLQREELQLSRKELSRSAEAQTKTAEFAGNQNEITNKQIALLEQNEKKSDIHKIIESSEKKIIEILNKETLYNQIEGRVKIKKVILIAEGLQEKDPRMIKVKEALKEDFEDIYFELKNIEKLGEDFTILAGHDYLENYYRELFKKIHIGISKLSNHESK